MKLMTFNVWFDDNRIFERTNDIVQIINKEQPDVVCLQEVRQDTLNIFVKGLTNYQITRSTSLTQGYDTMIFVKNDHSILGRKRYEFTGSVMGRNIELVLLTLKDGTVWVTGTFHLESVFGSPENTDIKRQQLKFSLDKAKELSTMSGAGHVAIMGDTNLGFREFYRFDKYWQDCWVSAGKPKDHTYTNDGTRNSNLNHKYRNRLDRVITDTGLEVDDFRLVGVEQPNPSDHFGITVTLK